MKLAIEAEMPVKIVHVFTSLLLGIAQHLPLYHFSPTRERCSEMKRSESKRWKQVQGYPRKGTVLLTQTRTE